MCRVRWPGARGWCLLVLLPLALMCFGLLPARAGTNLSAWASPGPGGRMLRKPDALGNRVLDYAGVGYRGGTVPIPDVPVKVIISPVDGDDGGAIQAAIDQVAALLPDADGFRGAVLLRAGEYQIAGSIAINAGGVVLRGEGDGTDGTVLRASGAGQRTLVTVQGSGSPATVAGTTHAITDAYVPVGARSFHVDDTAGLSAGDRVFVRRLANDAWIQVLGMDQLCCPPDVNPWTASGYTLDMDRVITRIEGLRITVDEPIACAIEARYGGGSIRAYTWPGRIRNCGVENLRGVSDYAATDDEDHGWTLLQFRSVEHGWARRVTSRYFGYSCVALMGGAKWITVADCRSLDPVSIITGGRRYAFVMDDCQLCLVQNGYTLKDRHQFVTQSLTMGPNVFVDGLSDTAYSDAGPHHRWGTGALWDGVTVNGNNLNIQNRGNLGSGHGWAGGNEVAWNCDADGGYVVQNPPTARNWLIGSIGVIESGTVYVGPHDPGTYDSHGTNVFPNSLYYAQLQDRLAAPGVQTLERWLGDLDVFAADNPTGEAAEADAAWVAAVEAAAEGAEMRGFDVVATNQWVPFTFQFTLATNERVVGASLAVSLRAASGAATSGVLCLERAINRLPLSGLGWSPVTTGTGATVRVLDLADRLEDLADGAFHVAVGRGLGVDWAMLELQVAPVLNAYALALPPVADATVRGGASAQLNYGTNATLDIKLESVGDNRRQAYLRWNLAGIPAAVRDARVRLAPVSVGTNGLEHGATLAAGAWSEATVTWSNQPGGGKRFATWIPATNAPVEFSVTPQAQAALAGDGQLSLELFSLKNVGGAGLVSYASREHPDPALRPQLILLLGEPVPFVSPLADLVLARNTNSGAIPFTVGDPAYDADLLAVGATSDNRDLVPPEGLVLGGAASNRTLTVTPAPGRSGTARITVAVTNPAGRTASSSFMATVTEGGTNYPAGWWIVDADGDWDIPGNWSDGLVVSGAGATATFAIDVTDLRCVNDDIPVTLGRLIFGDADPASPGSWLVTNGTITLQAASGTPVISVRDGDATLASALAGTQGLSKQGEGTLVLAGSNTFRGAAGISTGALRAAHPAALGATGSGNQTTISGGSASARLELSGGVAVSEPITISCKAAAAGNIPSVVNVEGTNTLAGTVSLTTGGSFWTFESAGGRLRVTGTATNTTTTNVRYIWLRGAADGEWRSVIADSAADLGTGVRKDDAGTWTLAGANTYSGPTVVSNGMLLVHGAIGGGAVTVAGGTLGGTGSIAAPVTVRAGAVLAPGASVGTLTIGNTLTLEEGSVTRVEIDAQTPACDRAAGITRIAYGGTLVVRHVAGVFAAGQTFALFGAGAATGTFSLITPPPGPDLAWAFDPAEGTLSVLPASPPRFLNLVLGDGGSFSVLGDGPTDGVFRVLATTYLEAPFVDWVGVATGSFSSGVFRFTDPDAASFPQRFYRIETP